MSWTPEKIATLKRLWAEGHSCSQIAARLGGGVTRNAVIGKVHRLGLDGRVSDLNEGRRRSRKTKAKSKPHPKPFHFGAVTLPRQKRAPGTATPPVPAPALTPFDGVTDIVSDVADPPLHERVDLLDLKPGQCKWPLGDPTKFCGRPQCDRGAGVYCTSHAARSYNGTSNPKRKWADDEPRRAAFAARARQTFKVREDA